MPLLGHGPSYIKSSRLLAGFSIHRTLTTPAHLLVKSVLLSSTVPCSPYNAIRLHTRHGVPAGGIICLLQGIMWP